MKTPEELAEEWASNRCPEQGPEFIVWNMCKDDFLAGYQAGRLNSKAVQAAAPQWISVKDRLPENISDVLILSKEKESCVGYYRSSDNDWNMYNPCCSFHMELHGVTHWMPLPKPPEE